MGLPRLYTCCWILDLKTGNILLGCINAFFSFAMFVMMIISAVTASSLEGTAGDDPEMKAVISGMYAMSVILVFLFLAKFLFDIMFVYGVVAERSGIIKSYYIMWLVFFLLLSFTFFMNITSYSLHHIIAQIIYLGVNVYAVLLCHSYYQQLNDREVV